MGKGLNGERSPSPLPSVTPSGISLEKKIAEDDLCILQESDRRSSCERRSANFLG